MAKVVVSKADQAAPKSVKATPETLKGEEDGKLKGVSSKMEYRLKGSGSSAKWTDCAGKTVTDLPSGTYQVRLKATDNYNAGAIKTVKVGWQAKTKLKVAKNAPAVKIDNLDDIVLALRKAKKLDSDSTFSLRVDVDAIAKPQDNADAKKITTLAAGKSLTYFDIDVTTTTEGDMVEKVDSLGSNVASIEVPYTTTGRTGIMAYRVHDGKAAALKPLTAKPTSKFEDGTFYVGTGSVTVYSSKFSTYAIGYDTKPATANAQTPATTANASNAGKATPATGDGLPGFVPFAVVGLLAIVVMSVALRFMRGR